MIVKELIEALKKFNPAAEVACTWEGTIKPIEVYQAVKRIDCGDGSTILIDSTVLIDGDNGDYRIKFQKLCCVICGKAAVVDQWENKPVCQKHCDTFCPPCAVCDNLADTTRESEPLCWDHYQEKS
jgi:hypothetical protein